MWPVISVTVASCLIGIIYRALHCCHPENNRKATLRAHMNSLDCFIMSFSVSGKAELQWWIDNDTSTNEILVKEPKVTLTIYASCQLRLGLFHPGLLLWWDAPSRRNKHLTPII